MILIETILFICIFVCVVLLAKCIHKKICCTETANASVRSKKEAYSYRDDNKLTDTEYTVSYPDESGERHTIKELHSPSKIVHYNPKNPSEAYGDEQQLVCIMIILGILIALFTVFLFLILTGK